MRDTAACLPACRTQRGFTLIELIVVIAIVAIVTSVILANNNRFGGRILLENLAYDIALTVRQAQVYGISVQRFGTSNFSAGYGMHFDKTNSPTTYLLFADTTGTGLYDANATPSEIVKSTSIQGGYKIVDLCTTPRDNLTETCSISSVDIVFSRPEPDACIGSGSSTKDAQGKCTFPFRRARVVLQSPRGDRMSVVVEFTGQISVQ